MLLRAYFYLHFLLLLLYCFRWAKHTHDSPSFAAVDVWFIRVGVGRSGGLSVLYVYAMQLKRCMHYFDGFFIAFFLYFSLISKSWLRAFSFQSIHIKCRYWFLWHYNIFGPKMNFPFFLSNITETSLVASNPLLLIFFNKFFTITSPIAKRRRALNCIWNAYMSFTKRRGSFKT